MFLHLSVILFTLGGGGVGPQCMLGYTPPEQTAPPGQTHPLDIPWADTALGRHPQGYTPLPSACWDTHGYCCGRHASYWNAFLLKMLSPFKSIRIESIQIP